MVKYPSAQFDFISEEYTKIILNSINSDNSYNHLITKLFVSALLFNSGCLVQKLIDYFNILFSYTRNYLNEEEKYLNKLKNKYKTQLRYLMRCINNYIENEKIIKNYELAPTYFPLIKIKELIEVNNINLKDKYVEFLFYYMKKFHDNQAKLEELKYSLLNEIINENIIENPNESVIEKNNDIINKKKEDLEKKYKEMKTELLKDRDKQINIIIEKLGEESLNERKKAAAEIEKKANEKNIALIEENNNLKNKITEMTNKLQAETKNRINMEQNIDILNKKIKTKELNYDMQENKLKELQQNYDDVVNKLSGLTREFNQEKMNLEIEMKSTLEKGDKELLILKNKLENAQKIFDKEKKDIEENHKKEIENLEQKIKKSFMRKDEIIRKLQEDVERKDLTIQKYEELLNQQRKELFGK
jgi:hypothetical protein